MDPTPVPDAWRIPDKLWDLLQIAIPPHVNPHPFGGGRPRTPDRVCADAIFFVLRTGCQWKALDATKFCPGSTAHDRFQQWVQAGVFAQWWKTGLLDYDYAEGIDWEWLSLDGCMTKAPLGGGKDRQKPYGSSQERRQTQPVGREPRRAGGLGGGRGQPPRPEDGPRHARKHPGRASRADRRSTAEPVLG
jgi:putative transposase